MNANAMGRVMGLLIKLVGIHEAARSLVRGVRAMYQDEDKNQEEEAAEEEETFFSPSEDSLLCDSNVDAHSHAWDASMTLDDCADALLLVQHICSGVPHEDFEFVRAVPGNGGTARVLDISWKRV
jgi:hypothetical protein